MVEHRADNAAVTGSSPVGSIMADPVGIHEHSWDASRIKKERFKQEDATDEDFEDNRYTESTRYVRWYTCHCGASKKVVVAEQESLLPTEME